MKAYILVDTDLLPDNIPIEDIYTKADLFYVGEELSGFGRYLKPLPERCEDISYIYNAHGEVEGQQSTEYARGWNDCLDEITGGRICRK